MANYFKVCWVAEVAKDIKSGKNVYVDYIFLHANIEKQCNSTKC